MRGMKKYNEGEKGREEIQRETKYMGRCIKRKRNRQRKRERIDFWKILPASEK